MLQPTHEPPLPPEFWSRLEAGETVPFQGLGDSMRPFFPSGTWFLLRQDPIHQLQVGDIVFMLREDQPIVHRITALPSKDSSQLKTCGDCYYEDDPPWKPSQYRARVVGTLEDKTRDSRRLKMPHDLLATLYRHAGPAIRIGLKMYRRIKKR